MIRFIKVLILAFIIIILGTQCQKKNPQIKIKTELGDIIIELYKDDAPITVNNFLKYIEEGRLDNSTFYRIVRDDNQNTQHNKIQVIQGGLFEDDHPLMLSAIEHETTKSTGIQHSRGTISMARYEPGTATSEFFICIADEPELDFGGSRNKDKAGFAAFGRVISGMEIVDKIHQSSADEQYLNPRIKIEEIKLISNFITYI